MSVKQAMIMGIYGYIDILLQYNFPHETESTIASNIMGSSAPFDKWITYFGLMTSKKISSFATGPPLLRNFVL